MKTITFRGGLAVFMIPDHWVVEENEDGGAYYDDRPGTGTLRLSVITARAPSGQTPVNGYEALLSLSSATEEVKRLPNGNGLKVSSEQTREQDQDLRIHRWSLACFVPPDVLGMAVFTWTTLAERAIDPEEIGQVDALIAAAALHPLRH